MDPAAELGAVAAGILVFGSSLTPDTTTWVTAPACAGANRAGAAGSKPDHAEA